MTATQTAHEQMVAAVRRLGYVFGRHEHATASRFGLTATDITALSYLSRHDRTGPSELATVLDLTTGSVTALLDRLEREAFVERRPHESDRRRITIEVTEHGRTAVVAMRADVEDILRELPESAHAEVVSAFTAFCDAADRVYLHDAPRSRRPSS